MLTKRLECERVSFLTLKPLGVFIKYRFNGVVIFWKWKKMASVNKVIIIGNLGRDPDTRYTAEGLSFINISDPTRPGMTPYAVVCLK